MVTKATIQFVRELKEKDQRLRHGLFVAEGSKLVLDLLRKGARPHQIFALEGWSRTSSIHRKLIEGIQTASQDQLDRMTHFKSPPSVIALFHFPENFFRQPPFDKGITLALDGIQDPGNVGTIIRTADWFGFRQFLLSPETADPFQPKVIQASMGAVWSAGFRQGRLSLLIQEILDQRPIPVIATDTEGTNLFSTKLPDQGIIILGSEGAGISTEIRDLASICLSLPPAKTGVFSESLNVSVASGIILSEFARQLDLL